MREALIVTAAFVGLLVADTTIEAILDKPPLIALFVAVCVAVSAYLTRGVFTADEDN